MENKQKNKPKKINKQTNRKVTGDNFAYETK